MKGAKKAKSAAAKVETKDMDKHELRKLADKLGVEWDKRVDDEKSLRSKIDAKLAKAGDAEANEGHFDTGKRAILREYTGGGGVLVKEGKKKGVPSDCFGYLFDKGNKRCGGECPHAKKCKELSESLGAAVEIIEAEEEVEKVTDDDAEEIAKAVEKKQSKVKPGKKAKDESLSKEEGAVDDDTEFKLTYDEDYALSIEDDDLSKFYKRLFKMVGDKSVPASGIVDVFATVFDVAKGERDSTRDELLKTMLDNGDIKRA